MTKKELKQKIKEEQKTLAQNIKRYRPLRKPHLFEAASLKIQQECLDWKVWNWSYEYRHRHIVYCNMFNNTPYALIENPRDNNRPNSKLLDKIRNDWESQIDEEALRNCA